MKPTYRFTLGRQAAARLGLGPSGTRLLWASPKGPAVGPASRGMTGSAVGPDDSGVATTIWLMAREVA